jgi:hypothetical protein
VKNDTGYEEPDLEGDFRGREKHECLSRSLHQGRIHGDPENPFQILRRGAK